MPATQNDYAYDNTGQRLTNQITDNTGTTRTEQYSYDDLNRLSTVDYGDGQTQGYSFDPMGNRLSRTDSSAGTTNYAFSAANMLTSAGGNSYTSDADGNTLTGGGRTNTWDSQNRLTSSTLNGVTSTYTYGADGLRRSSTVNGITTNYVYDGQNMVEEMRAGAVYATYLTGPRGPEYRRDANGAVSWYVYDGLGSVVAEVAPDGTVTANEKYDVYGALRQGSGAGSTTRHHFVGGLGHIADQETGLIYMRARYYDPAVGDLCPRILTCMELIGIFTQMTTR